ncbi:FecR family protein [Mucilaginibacter yixingensis]|uniref:FecR family protein n=1 Tax=Mucilaginibacter yixingensis TaxID=1295612 RepID=A0A2T5JFN3_9SPHI|nr:FecR domain-containing protein [Mucilaginibacter yixingensis]PTR01194.1 FecR family protein [Mucilaginibacter yixingensis]
MNWDLLLNYVNGECTAAEEEQVNAWANEQTEHRYLLTYLERRAANLNQPLKQNDIDEQWLRLLDRIFEAPRNSNNSGFLRSYWITGVAASLLLFSVLGWLYFKKSIAINNMQQQVAQTSANTRDQVTLPDGSVVYMAPNSKITFTNAFNGSKREVHLTGEAFFDVKHLTNKPFIIHTDNKLSVTVLGTSFSVYARPHINTEVKVATGLVGVTTGNKVNYLKAGQELIFSETNHLASVKTVLAKEAASLQNQTLVFDKSDAGEIAEKLHRWYNVNVVAQPSAYKRPLFSGEMKDTGIADVLGGLTYATGLHYKYSNSNTILLF